MKTSLFDYELPDELIAAHPPEHRDGARLLVFDLAGSGLDHRRIVELPGLLAPGTLLVVNDTRVFPARLRARRPSGGAVELLLVREIGRGPERCRWSALARANKPLKIGDALELGGGIGARVDGKGERGEVTVEIDAPWTELRALLDTAGETPLPPYIRRPVEPSDRERYQTVFAREEGSVAAPTAGLHFSEPLLDALDAAGIERTAVTLHVGPGTFRPIVADSLAEHEMDGERYELSEDAVARIDRARAQGRPVVAVGTTVVRALEGCHARHGALRAGGGETRLFITPGFEFAVVDGLLTNFHLPRSTLLSLVSALGGRERVLAAYREAVAQRYRFYSYGDAMLLRPATARREEGR